MNTYLNPNIETLLLLIGSPWGDTKNAIIKELDLMGIDGTSFYTQHCTPVERYYATFAKHQIVSPGTLLLSASSDFMIAIYCKLFWLHPEWFENLEDTLEPIIQDIVKDVIQEQLESKDDIISTLETSEITDQEKWQIVLLLQKSKQQLSDITIAIKENILAYEKALAQVKSDVSTLLGRFHDITKDTRPTGLLRLPKQYNESVIIVPTLALPLSVLVLDEVCFYGLLNDRVFRDTGASLSKEELLVCTKSISEKSKVEILLCLKKGSMYNLEIAEQIGLTPATVSHHMSSLLTTGFVDFQKSDGKVYYSLSPAGIQRYLTEIGKLFLI